VCKFLYFIIFVPYNLFRLFLVHKILVSRYICENGKKKWERKKIKDFPASRAGGFRPTWRERARAGALSAHLAQPRGATTGDCAVARGPHARERGWLTVLTATEGGEGARPGSGRRRSPRRFSAAGPVLRRGGGGKARAGDGGHGGGANFACGDLWRPIRGTVAGARGGYAAGEVAGHNRGGEVVPCDRERASGIVQLDKGSLEGGKGAHRSDEGSTAAQA
jgi:hypothetical protein